MDLDLREKLCKIGYSPELAAEALRLVSRRADVVQCCQFLTMFVVTAWYLSSGFFNNSPLPRSDIVSVHHSKTNGRCISAA